MKKLVMIMVVAIVMMAGNVSNIKAQAAVVNDTISALKGVEMLVNSKVVCIQNFTRFTHKHVETGKIDIEIIQPQVDRDSLRKEFKQLYKQGIKKVSLTESQIWYLIANKKIKEGVTAMFCQKSLLIITNYPQYTKYQIKKVDYKNYPFHIEHVILVKN